MIKNIIFDLSEVIISGYHGTEELIGKKYDISAEEFYKRKIEKTDIFLDLMRGKLKEEEYWQEFLKGKDWNITIEDLKATVRENLNQPVDGTMEIIRKLKGKYQLILLSDQVREWMEYIKERNTDIKIFNQIILSYEIGSLKTDKQTFTEVLNKTQIVADETLFIDDYDQNVKRAEEVGIHGIIFKDAKQLKGELEKQLKETIKGVVL